MNVVQTRLGRAIVAAACATTLCAASAVAESRVIVVPVPLTGPRAELGRSISAAATMIAQDLQTAGHGPQPLVVLDDACAPATAISLAAEIAASPAVAVIGHACPAAARAAAPIYAKAGKLFLAAGASLARQAAVLRLPVVDEPGTAIGRWLLAHAQGRERVRFAIVRDKTQLNRTLASGIEATLKTRGLVAISEVITGGDKDFAALAQRLKLVQVTHVALLAFPIEAALAAADIVSALPAIDIIGPDHLAQGDFAALAGPAAERIHVLLPATAARYAERSPKARELSARLLAAGIAPTREALETAAALETVVAALRQAPDPSLAGRAAALQLPRETVLGPLAFDAEGDARLPYWLAYRWRDGVLSAEP